MEVEAVFVRQPPDQLHDGLTAHFRHPVEEDDLLVRPRCVVQLASVQLEKSHLTNSNNFLKLDFHTQKVVKNIIG